MNENGMVRTYDLKSKIVRQIPGSELAPGYVLAWVPEVGNVYLNSSQIKLNTRLVHRDLSDECKQVIRFCMQAIGTPDPRTYEEHLTAFLADQHPVLEIQMYFHTAHVYAHFAKQKVISWPARRDLFYVVSICALSERSTILDVLDFQNRHLSRPRIEEVVAYFFDCDWRAELQARFNVDLMAALA